MGYAMKTTVQEVRMCSMIQFGRNLKMEAASSYETLKVPTKLHGITS